MGRQTQSDGVGGRDLIGKVECGWMLLLRLQSCGIEIMMWKERDGSGPVCTKGMVVIEKPEQDNGCLRELYESRFRRGTVTLYLDLRKYK